MRKVFYTKKNSENTGFCFFNFINNENYSSKYCYQYIALNYCSKYSHSLIKSRDSYNRYKYRLISLSSYLPNF